ncbi:MAG: (2Fe-2S)-binding protein [Phycisphaerales bacterium]
MAVDRCVCTNQSFAVLKHIRDRHDLDFDGLCQKTECCRGCTMCAPYVREMIRTGRTSFSVLTSSVAAEPQRAH